VAHRATTVPLPTKPAPTGPVCRDPPSYGGDDVRGEPHWVARPTDSGTVVIGYLLSYYRDEGCRALGCGALGADRHNGDSEDIYLELYYNFSTQHWVLLQALYSQHGDYGVYSKGSDEYPTQLFYPWHPGAYPRTYVSEGKHANYSSVSECDWGDYLQDDCDDDNTSARVDTYRFGQSKHRQQRRPFARPGLHAERGPLVRVLRRWPDRMLLDRSAFPGLGS